MANSIDLKNFEKEVKDVIVKKISSEASKEGLKTVSNGTTITITGDDAKVKKFIEKLGK